MNMPTAKTKGKDNQWYNPDTVTGKFVDGVVRELIGRGYEFAGSGSFRQTVNGVGVAGVRGTYAQRTGRFSWNRVDVCDGGNQPASSGMVVYYKIRANVGKRQWRGIPLLGVGIASGCQEWTHVGVPTDIYGQDKQPSQSYDPGISPTEALRKAGLEAKVN